MGNIQHLEPSYFDSFASELNGKFQRLRHLTDHDYSSGDYHEEILRGVLRNFLTKRYSVKTGFIFKEEHEVSRQIDIIIVDENAPAAYVFQEGDFAVVMPEAVVAIIEVKTTLGSEEYDLALENIASAKKLFENPINHPGIIFGYQSSTNDRKMTDTVINNWFKRPSTKTLKSPSDINGPDALIWLNDNFSMLRYNFETKKINDSMQFHRFQNPESETGWQLSVLLAIIVGACEQGEFNRTHQFGSNLAGRLLQLGIMDVSDDGFKWSVGKVEAQKQ